MKDAGFRTTLVFKKASQDKHGLWCSSTPAIDSADTHHNRSDRIDRVIISKMLSLEEFNALGRKYARAWLLSDGSEQCLVSKLNNYLQRKDRLGSTVTADVVVVPDTLRQQLAGGPQHQPPAPGSLLLFVTVPIGDRKVAQQPIQQQLPSPSTSQADNNCDDAVGSLLECSVCLDLLQDPILLCCPHSLCRCCAERLHGSGSDFNFVRCPICRKDTDVLDAAGMCTQTLLQRAIQRCDAMPEEGRDPAKAYSAASSATGFPTKLAGWQLYFNKLELYSQIHHIDSPRMQLAMAHPPPRLLQDVKQAIANLQWCLESDRAPDWAGSDSIGSALPFKFVRHTVLCNLLAAHKTTSEQRPCPPTAHQSHQREIKPASAQVPEAEVVLKVVTDPDREPTPCSTSFAQGQCQQEHQQQQQQHQKHQHQQLQHQQVQQHPQRTLSTELNRCKLAALGEYKAEQFAAAAVTYSRALIILNQLARQTGPSDPARADPRVKYLGYRAKCYLELSRQLQQQEIASCNINSEIDSLIQLASTSYELALELEPSNQSLKAKCSSMQL